MEILAAKDYNIVMANLIRLSVLIVLVVLTCIGRGSSDVKMKEDSWEYELLDRAWEIKKEDMWNIQKIESILLRLEKDLEFGKFTK